ncbi:MAG: aminotransferase class I/II-fold pyridoxal phosphate-dependent enzyme [Acidimicrobiales bacterium]
MANEAALNLAEHRLRRSEAGAVDLATGLNRYGPPQAVLDALRSLTAADIALPPSHAAERLEAAYARVLDVDPTELMAGRGPSEFLWDLSRMVPHHSVAVPLPAWGEVLDVFPGRGFSRYPGEQLPSVDQVDEALDCFELVVISNPQMPSGVTLDREGLLDTARRHPASTLVVDESAIEFLPDPAAATLVGSDADNVIVLRSSAEFYGTAAARAGVAWSRDRQLLRSLFGHREALPLSGLDVVVAEAALASTEWADDARHRLAADGAWLEQVLRPLGGRLIAGSGLPYRCIFSDIAVELATTLAASGIIVRALGPGHGVHPGALGLFAPLEAERSVLATAFGAVHANPPVLSEAG